MSSNFSLTDLDLFGNEAAEDEDDDIFNSYALARPELDLFTSKLRKVQIARAYKGEGKSALLRLAANRVEADRERPVVVRASATELAPILSDVDFSLWVRSWKAALLGNIAAEVGATIGWAWTDDDMSLVEEAERRGFKSRNIVSAVLDRLKPAGVEFSGLKLETPAKERIGTTNPEKTIARWATSGTPAWLFIDDVDLNFQNTPLQRVKVASFFVACREITNSVSRLRVRTAVRPNVWTILKLEFESLSHVEQYTTDLRWSEDSIRSLIALRIEAYFRRHDRWPQDSGLPSANQKTTHQDPISLVFESPMQWGKSTRPPHVLIATLSKYRPRWAIELCKVSADAANKKHHDRISRSDIFENLDAFGRRRLEDTCAEFRSQCEQVEELIDVFNRGNEQYKTDELLKLITNRILEHLEPKIFGVVGRASARDVAAFLFEAGIFFGRRNLSNGEYQHISFPERPSLWKSRVDFDQGLAWEVHPVFRQALEIRDSEGREYAKLQGRGRAR